MKETAAFSTITHSPKETETLAYTLAGTLSSGAVIAYRGGLGAGKTAFTRGLAHGLGIDPREVSSPTFALINEYHGPKHSLIHFDMYRISDYDSLFFTGFFDYLDTDAVLAIEWSENIEEFLPPDTIIITLTPQGETERLITIEGSSL